MRVLIFILLSAVAVTAVGAQDHSQHRHQQDNNPFEGTEVEYVCPMHSQIVKDEPGSCPICGMELVAREKPKTELKQAQTSDAAMASLSFQVPTPQQRALRVVTTRAERKDLQPELNAQAQVSWQESAKYHIHSRVEGWVEELYADVEGEWVEQGDKLYRVYAPELVVAQDDYLQLLDSLNEVGDKRSQQRFKRRGQQRLRLLGMSEAQIERLEQTRQTAYEVDYYAPRSGYLTALNIRQGMYVNPGLELMTITGDQKLWFMLDIPSWYADQIAVGQRVHLSVESVDGHWMNTIDYIYPQVDENTQTLTARVPVDDSVGSLREGLWATARVELKAVNDAVVIPLKSLIQTGQNSRVIVQTAEQQFAVREVKTGLRVDDEIEITAGLKAGERVVTNGQFLLDSEASLRGLQLTADKPLSMQHVHGGH